MIRLIQSDENKARQMAFNGGRYPQDETSRLLRLALHEIEFLRSEIENSTKGGFMVDDFRVGDNVYTDEGRGVVVALAPETEDLGAGVQVELRVRETRRWFRPDDVHHLGTENGTSVAPEPDNPQNTGSKPEVGQ